MSRRELAEAGRYLRLLNRTAPRYRLARIQDFSIIVTEPRDVAHLFDLDRTYDEIARIEREVNRERGH